jgi:hypothetical protein
MNDLLRGIARGRVSGKAGRVEEATMCRSRALSLIGDAVDKLSPGHATVLLWQLGLSGETLDVATIAGRLLLPEWRVDQLLEEALVELGWALVCAEHDREPVAAVAA